MSKIRVMIVEDDTDWIKAISIFLNSQNDMYIAATAVSRNEAVSIARMIELDVILMDLNMEGNHYDGIYAAAEISQFSQARIIMLTSLNDEGVIKDSFLAGAVNFISKKNYSFIPQAIRMSLSTENPMGILIKEYQHLKEKEQLSVLSSSEREVFTLALTGSTSTQIGKALFKTKSTIKNQMNAILKKLGARSRNEAIYKIKTHGLLPYRKDK